MALSHFSSVHATFDSFIVFRLDSIWGFLLPLSNRGIRKNPFIVFRLLGICIHRQGVLPVTGKIRLESTYRTLSSVEHFLACGRQTYFQSSLLSLRTGKTSAVRRLNISKMVKFCADWDIYFGRESENKFCVFLASSRTNSYVQPPKLN